MSSRLWTDPPLKPDGMLDYAQCTVAEICEDLTETLCDLVINAGESALEPFVDELPDHKKFTTSAPPSSVLVKNMDILLRLIATDDLLRSDAARDAVRGAIDELLICVDAPRH